VWCLQHALDKLFGLGFRAWDLGCRAQNLQHALEKGQGKHGLATPPPRPSAPLRTLPSRPHTPRPHVTAGSGTVVRGTARPVGGSGGGSGDVGLVRGAARPVRTLPTLPLLLPNVPAPPRRSRILNAPRLTRLGVGVPAG